MTLRVTWVRQQLLSEAVVLVTMMTNAPPDTEDKVGARKTGLVLTTQPFTKQRGGLFWCEVGGLSLYISIYCN